MTERGMIFNGEMVRAILDGRKTQTRRPVKFPILDRNLGCELAGNELAGELSAGNYLNSAFGKPGDRIWVRETFQGPLFDYDLMDSYCKDPTPFEKPEFCVYKADGVPAPEFYDADDELHCCWRPSIHMPRWASRILLEITDVRVERLNAISQEDAQAEGMELAGWRPTYSDPDSGGEVMTPYDNFAELWSSIYGEESWNANPWVWVISFKRVE
ncbi:TPA: morphogenetic protein [Klebsiella pneumoniae]|uniref:morphogenetic protein n=1 Tax=Klebsiella pneumoniae TaxID=573 RepID=UPI000D1FEF69|nr:morphogenetic protein [Klebsiella pneumoniae]AVI89764.1 morphogenetic protein [Klebsiella pneumoniae]EKL1152394.1 morphogenetic protein [Klebsiella pneumoniae]MCD1273822.1 morphogenetic protein [Klebsiella pneumoniae]MCK5965278.1 morphogenetic protein [Klebsiella pneumoniae]RTR15781.1 morphogenetic protein [Klebsiella pneumoniae]